MITFSFRFSAGLAVRDLLL